MIIKLHCVVICTLDLEVCNFMYRQSDGNVVLLICLVL